MPSPGARYGRWTLIEPRERRHGDRDWLCRCDCGTERIVNAKFLRDGRSRSCGCLLRASAQESLTTHGLSKTPEYGIWCGLKARCQNPNNAHFARYGGRGITVCEEWTVFEHFLADMGPRPSAGHTVERIDNAGPYAPWNCRWATRQEQQNNTRRNRRLTYDGRTQTLQEWSTETGINLATLHHRLERGWSVEDTLTRRPARGGSPRVRG